MLTTLMLRLLAKLFALCYALCAAQASRRDRRVGHALVTIAPRVRLGLLENGFRNVLGKRIVDHLEVRVVCDECACYGYVLGDARVLSV